MQQWYKCAFMFQSDLIMSYNLRLCSLVFAWFGIDPFVISIRLCDEDCLISCPSYRSSEAVTYSGRKWRVVLFCNGITFKYFRLNAYTRPLPAYSFHVSCECLAIC